MNAPRRAAQLALVQAETPPLAEPMPARSVAAALEFHVAGGRTRLGRQRVPYPFHITRAFHLDGERPDLTTLYLQSASGGLYRGDRLTLNVAVGQGAAAHITTQAATIVHDTRDADAVLTTRIDVEAGGFLAYTPDPLLLFPGAAMTSTTELTLGECASAILSDGLTWHDPAASGRVFDWCAIRTLVRDRHGRLVVSDRGIISGEEFLGNASPAGAYRAAGTLLVLGPGSERLDPAEFESNLDAVGCLSGVSRTPGGIGVSARILAPDGGSLARGLGLAFALAFKALTGVEPAARRK